MIAEWVHKHVWCPPTQKLTSHPELYSATHPNSIMDYTSAAFIDAFASYGDLHSALILMQCSKDCRNQLNNRMNVILKNDENISSKVIKVVRIINNPEIINSTHPEDTLDYFKDWANKFQECNMAFNFGVIKHIITTTPEVFCDMDTQQMIVDTCVTFHDEVHDLEYCQEINHMLVNCFHSYLNWFHGSLTKYNKETLILSFGFITRIMIKVLLWSASHMQYNLPILQSTFVDVFLAKTSYFKDMAGYITNDHYRGEFVTILTMVNKVANAWMYVWLNKHQKYTIQFGSKGGVFVKTSSKNKKYF